VLAGRKTSGCITGEVYFNGRQGHPSPKRCSYVTQDNVHIGCFTVRETLHFASLLRVREGASSAERAKRVDDVMMMLGLEGVADVIVGDALRKGISGGQARRLTIGVEICNLPDLIFLDEPTTGLDSNISYEVCLSARPPALARVAFTYVLCS
jgi:ABC-type multidrug transport system ATPase subunit